MSDNHTASADYSMRLRRLSGSWWRRLLDVQRPYRWNLNRLAPGTVLDVGCGIGRNLCNLPSSSVGVDHNLASVSRAHEQGLTAYLPSDFHASDDAVPKFDSLLFSHVLEHMDERAADALIAEFLPYLKKDGRLLIITPQERGFNSDPTHVRFVDVSALHVHAKRHGFRVIKSYSFPFPRLAGKMFTYNEFVVVAERDVSLNG
jgi:SAM-dependent methyltransferase